ncbi:MAG TPA: VTT domain-containing protein [Tabrizicola sp.]|nr:VTT domain-containing protein [Tabrizicola sp.]
MTDWLLALVPQYGLWLLAATTFFSCLALPFPASILMLTAGGFSAAGDQLGYWAGRGMGLPALNRLRADPGRDRLLARANALMDRKGVLAVFFSRWLVSPLGPWVNLLAGSTGCGWLRFTIPGVAGEAVWAGLYVGTGYVFGGNIEAASDMLGSVLGLVGGLGAVVALGYWLFGSIRQGV